MSTTATRQEATAPVGPLPRTGHGDEQPPRFDTATLDGDLRSDLGALPALPGAAPGDVGFCYIHVVVLMPGVAVSASGEPLTGENQQAEASRARARAREAVHARLALVSAASWTLGVLLVFWLAPARSRDAWTMVAAVVLLVVAAAPWLVRDRLVAARVRASTGAEPGARAEESTPL